MKGLTRPRASRVCYTARYGVRSTPCPQIAPELDLWRSQCYLAPTGLPAALGILNSVACTSHHLWPSSLRLFLPRTAQPRPSCRGPTASQYGREHRGGRERREESAGIPAAVPRLLPRERCAWCSSRSRHRQYPSPLPDGGKSVLPKLPCNVAKLLATRLQRSNLGSLSSQQ